jgi:sarcosine oxidase, subunit gamma
MGETMPADAVFAIQPVPAMTRHILRGDMQVVAQAGAALGLDVPVRPLTSAEAGPVAVLWLGPDEWLVLDAPAGFAGTLAGLAHSLVDVSHRQVALRLTGRSAARVLSAGCPLDLSRHAFPSGMVARTIFHKAEIVIWRRPTGLHVEVWRSFAPYLTAHLAEAERATRGLPDKALP